MNAGKTPADLTFHIYLTNTIQQHRHSLLRFITVYSEDEINGINLLIRIDNISSYLVIYTSYYQCLSSQHGCHFFNVPTHPSPIDCPQTQSHPPLLPSVAPCCPARLLPDSCSMLRCHMSGADLEYVVSMCRLWERLGFQSFHPQADEWVRIQGTQL